MQVGPHPDADALDGFLVADVRLRQPHLERTACFLHRLIGIGAQIHDDLVDLGRVSHNRVTGVG